MLIFLNLDFLLLLLMHTNYAVFKILTDIQYMLVNTNSIIVLPGFNSL